MQSVKKDRVDLFLLFNEAAELSNRLFALIPQSRDDLIRHKRLCQLHCRATDRCERRSKAYFDDWINE